MKKQRKLIVEYVLIVMLIIACAILAVNLLKQVKEYNELETFLEESAQNTPCGLEVIESKTIQNNIPQ